MYRTDSQTDSGLMVISIYGKESENPVFNEKVYNNATLFVSQGCAEKYKSKRGWWDFIWIKEMK